MRLQLNTVATTTLLGSLFLLLAVFQYQSEAQDKPKYSAHRRALQHRKRASSDSSGPPNPTRGGPAWHEHPMWNHPALHEGAKLFPSSSSESSPKPSSSHSFSHSLASTGAGGHTSHHQEEVTSHLNKGKGIASGSGAGSGAGHGLQRHSVQTGRKLGTYTTTGARVGRPPGVKDSGPRTKKVGPTARMGRPVGKKDSTPRGPQKNKNSAPRGPHKYNQAPRGPNSKKAKEPKKE